MAICSAASNGSAEGLRFLVEILLLLEKEQDQDKNNAGEDFGGSPKQTDFKTFEGGQVRA